MTTFFSKILGNAACHIGSLAIALLSISTLSPAVSAAENPCLDGKHYPLNGVISFAIPSTIRVNQRPYYTLAGLIRESAIHLGNKPDSPIKANALINSFLSDQTAQFIAITPQRMRQDRYGRTQAFILSRPKMSAPSGGSSVSELLKDPDGELLQEQLINAGLARVDVANLSVACARHLLTQEDTARREQKGYWKSNIWKIKKAKPDHLSAMKSTYQIISGTPHSISRNAKGKSYINFGRYWKEDVTATLGKKSLKQWEEGNNSLEALKDQPILIRGWIEAKDGPLIRITHPAQLILDVGDETLE